MRGRFPPLPASPATPRPKPPIDASFSRDAEERRRRASTAAREAAPCAPAALAPLASPLPPRGAPSSHIPSRFHLSSLKMLAAGGPTGASPAAAPPPGPPPPPLPSDFPPVLLSRRSPPMELPSGTPASGGGSSVERSAASGGATIFERSPGPPAVATPQRSPGPPATAALPAPSPIEGAADLLPSIDALVGSARVGDLLSGRHAAATLKSLSLETERLVRELWGAEDDAGIAAALARPLHFFHPPLAPRSAGAAAQAAALRGASLDVAEAVVLPLPGGGGAAEAAAPTPPAAAAGAAARDCVDSLSARALITSPLGALGRRATPSVRPLAPPPTAASKGSGRAASSLGGGAPPRPAPPSPEAPSLGEAAAVAPLLCASSQSQQLEPPAGAAASTSPTGAPLAPPATRDAPVDLSLQAALALLPLISRPLDALDSVLLGFKEDSESPRAAGQGGAQQPMQPRAPPPQPQRASLQSVSDAASGFGVDSWTPFAALLGMRKEGGVEAPTTASLFRR